MVVDPELLEGLEAAVAASPDNVPLRLHLGLLLLRAGRHADALEQCAAVLQRMPDHRGALDLAASATMAVEPPRWTTHRREPLREAARAGASVASAARPLAAEQPVAFEEGEPEESEELARGSHVATLLEDLGLEIEPAGVTLATSAA